MNVKRLCLTALVATFALGCGQGTECDTYYRDRDGDGFGDPDRSRFVCRQPRNYVTNDRDCDDRDETARPTGTWEGNLIVTGEDEGELQAFIDACPGTVVGNISISGTDRDEVGFLRSLGQVEGTLTIENNPELDDLRGIQNLTEVGTLALSLTQGLRDLDELDSLEVVRNLRLNLRLTDEESTLEVFEDVTGIQDMLLNVVGINNFVGLPELTELEGGLVLGGPSINSLEGVEAITSIGGTFRITNFRNDVDFSMLPLTSVGNIFRVNDNNGLQTVSLPNLTSSGAIDVRNNGALRTLSLPAMTSTGAITLNSNGLFETFESGLETATDLDLTNLPELTSVEGFPSLDAVELEGLIVRNTGVASLSGLGGVTSVVTAAQVVGNADLVDTKGLDGLTEVGGTFQIVNNSSLESLVGLGSLESASLEIADNGLLTSLEGLDALTESTTLSITGNLGLLSLDGIETLTTVETILVENNGNLSSIEGLNSVTGASSATFRNNPALSEADVDAWLALVGAKNVGVFVNEGNAP